MEQRYWETYAGQDVTGFSYIGNDMEVKEVTPENVEELEQYFIDKYGSQSPIKIFKE